MSKQVILVNIFKWPQGPNVWHTYLYDILELHGICNFDLTFQLSLEVTRCQEEVKNTSHIIVSKLYILDLFRGVQWPLLGCRSKWHYMCWFGVSFSYMWGKWNPWVYFSIWSPYLSFLTFSDLKWPHRTNFHFLWHSWLSNDYVCTNWMWKWPVHCI